MFATRKMKMAMAIAAVAAVGAVAPAMASAAPQWNTSATGAPGQAVTGMGELTLVWSIGGVNRTIMCGVAFDADLWNATDGGSVRGLGRITSFRWGSGEATPCSTSLGCPVTIATDTSPPWGIRVADDGTVGISGLDLTYQFSYCGSSLSGRSGTISGAVGGGALLEEGELMFMASPGLTTPGFGATLLTGSLGLYWADDQSAVELS